MGGAEDTRPDPQTEDVNRRSYTIIAFAQDRAPGPCRLETVGFKNSCMAGTGRAVTSDYWG
jgi:hypothetical protein